VSEGRFWDAARAGELQLQRCGSCGHLRYPVSDYCPQCLATETVWETLSGDGEVYSFGVFRHQYKPDWPVPYTVALIKLAEGPTLISNVVGIDPEDVRVGLPVSVVFEDGIPKFAPRGGEA
jgi:uncharacterized OB-fold protein